MRTPNITVAKLEAIFGDAHSARDFVGCSPQLWRAWVREGIGECRQAWIRERLRVAHAKGSLSPQAHARVEKIFKL